MNQPNLTLIAHRASAGPEPPPVGRERIAVMVDNQATAGTVVRVGSAAPATAEELPKKIFERSTGGRRYAPNTQIADAAVVCRETLIAQYVRFGGTFYATGYPINYATAYSDMFASYKDRRIPDCLCDPRDSELGPAPVVFNTTTKFCN